MSPSTLNLKYISLISCQPHWLSARSPLALDVLLFLKVSFHISVQSSSNDKNLPSFWIPSLTPEATPTLIKQPDSKTYCPMSKKPLKIKDLIPVKFTLINTDSKPLVAKTERYKCAVTGDTLGNSVPCAVLRNTGNVVTMDCVEKLIKKDMLCPFTGAKLREKDIVAMQRGGTGFAASGVTLEAKKSGPAMQA